MTHRHPKFWHLGLVPLICCGVLLMLKTTNVGAAPVETSFGAPLLAPSLAKWQLQGAASAPGATLETFAPQNTEFSNALRVTVPVLPRSSRDLSVVAPLAGAVKKDEALLVTFWARAAHSKAETAEISLNFALESASEPHERVFGTIYTGGSPSLFSVGPAWQKMQVPFQIGQDFAPGAARARFDVGFGVGILEIGGVTLENYGATPLAQLPTTVANGYAGRELDAPWRAQAKARINELRKGDLFVRVADAQGRPVEGARVEVKMTRHAFGFGSAVQAAKLARDGAESAPYRAHIKQLFSRVVFENDLKWPQWEQIEKRPVLLKSLDWLDQNGIEARGHVLLWPNWRWVPKDLEALKDNPAALRKRVLDHAESVVSATRGRLTDWDVINEPYTHHAILDITGDDLMTEVFRKAREADPEVALYINDFGILSGGGNDTAHQAHYEKTIKYLVDNGTPIDGIGFQGHFGSALTSPEKMLRILDRYAKFGLKLQVTEFDVDVRDEQLQADFTRDILTVMFSHPAANAFVSWGFWEGAHWKPQCAMFRRDWSIKPNGKAYSDLVLKEWWTHETGETGRNGDLQTSAFCGDYEITVEFGGKKQTIKTTLAREGRKVEIVLN